MANSKKRCPNCKKYNKIGDGKMINNSLFCSIDCAIELANKRTTKEKIDTEKSKRARIRKRKLELKTRSEWLKDAQAVFNKYIRLRDDAEPCISCGRHHTGQYHAGHYRTVGAHPELRFNELNCHKQCSACNNYKSGNIVEYRINLKNKIGDDKLAWLEGGHESKKYTIDEIRELITLYRNKYKKLKI